MRSINRRRFLYGTGGVLVALPLLETFAPRRARAGKRAVPRRIIFEHKANGDEANARFTSTGETDFGLGEFLAPLEAYRKDLLFINNVDKRHEKLPRTIDKHIQGIGGLGPWPFADGNIEVFGQKAGHIAGPTADYAIGGRVIDEFPEVPMRHLAFRLGTKKNNHWTFHAHAGPAGEDNPIVPDSDPWEVYKRLFDFTEDPAGEAELAKQIAMKRSAIDLAKDELGSLRNKVSSADWQKLDQHFEALRDVERELDAGGTPQGGGCSPVDLGNSTNPESGDDHEKVMDVFHKVMALALACDKTRVINFATGGSADNRVYRNLGINGGHHDISHNSDAGSFAQIRKIYTHLWTKSTHLYDLLRQTPDVDDTTLWDNTVIVHWSELGQGDRHSAHDGLVVLAGGAQGHFKMNRLIEKKGTPEGFADLLISMFHYMGYDDVTEFGTPGISNGPMNGLV